MKFYAQRGLAVVFIAIAGTAFLLRPDSFAIHTLGLLAIVVSLWLVRRSNAGVRRAQGLTFVNWSRTAANRRVGPLAWTLTGASLFACGLFYFLMYVDAVHGGKEAWPAYGFAGAGLAAAVAVGYVVMKLSQS